MLTADRRPLVALVFLLGGLAGACRSQPSTPPAPPVSPDVWASVDGHEIRREAIEKAYRRSVEPNPQRSGEEETVAKLNLLNTAIVQEILLARATALNIALPDAELDAAYKNAQGSIPDDAFTRELAARELTVADLRDSLRRDLLTQKVIERDVLSKVIVTDKDITDFFEANKAQFNLNEEAYRIAQIVVTPVKDANLNNRTGDDAATPQAAAAKITMLMERLKSGALFNELAMDYSEEPQSAQQGGEIGLVPLSALRQAPPKLRDAVLKATPGTVNVVAMEGGYTIVALMEKQAAGQRDLSTPDVKEGITATLRGRREQLLRSAYLEAVRDKATVINHLARRLVDSPGTLASSSSTAKP